MESSLNNKAQTAMVENFDMLYLLFIFLIVSQGAGEIDVRQSTLYFYDKI